MARYTDEFVVLGIIRLHEDFRRLIATANRAGNTALAAELAIVYAWFNDELDLLARAVAKDAVKQIRNRIRATQKRAYTVTRPYLVDQVKARPEFVSSPWATGAVGVGDIDALDKAINPRDPGKFSYWRSQEYGARPSNKAVYGYFWDRGMNTRSRPSQAQFRVHPIFMASKPGQRMIWRRPIEPRHFVRDGADRAYRDWLAGIGQIQGAAIAGIRAVLAGQAISARVKSKGRLARGRLRRLP